MSQESCTNGTVVLIQSREAVGWTSAIGRVITADINFTSNGSKCVDSVIESALARKDGINSASRCRHLHNIADSRTSIVRKHTADDQVPIVRQRKSQHLARSKSNRAVKGRIQRSGAQVNFC